MRMTDGEIRERIAVLQDEYNAETDTICMAIKDWRIGELEWVLGEMPHMTDKPEIPELTEEGAAQLIVFPYTTVWSSSEIREIAGHAYRAGAQEMDRRWREREGKQP